MFSEHVVVEYERAWTKNSLAAANVIFPLIFFIVVCRISGKGLSQLSP